MIPLQQLAEIAGSRNVRAATEADHVCGLQPAYVVEPETAQQLAAVLAAANAAGSTVIPRGQGSKLDWGNPPRSADIVLSTKHLNRVIEHAWADLTVTVEAGCTVAALQQALAKHGQRLAVDPLWPERATIGGILSCNDCGPLHNRFGALRDLIIGVTLALPDGTLASSGGKVVKNVAGYDLPKLATGALGTLGIITRAVFRLHPLPWTTSSLTCMTSQISESKRVLEQILDSQLAFSTLQLRLLDIARPETFVDILFEGTPQGIDAQIAHLQSRSTPLTFSPSDNTVWGASQALHSQARQNSLSAVLKMTAYPADIVPALMDLKAARNVSVHVQAAVQATGIGTLLFTGKEPDVRNLAHAFRKRMEAAGGSLVSYSSSLRTEDFDAWGNPGDSLPLMRAIKYQLDPNNTLNPGRFVGRI